MRQVLFWDVDGTLLSTARAGVFALEAATREVAGRTLDLQALETRGLPDNRIAERILESAGVPADETGVARFLAAYEEHLPASLHRRQGAVMPRVVETLRFLSSRPAVLSLLLTGNTRAGARAKLAHYGLEAFFDDGGFAEPGRDRPAIARAALAVAERTLGEPVPPGACLVIGDTPHDVEAGAAIGARTLAVATGGYTLDELRACGPWRALGELPPPDELERMIADASPAAARD